MLNHLCKESPQPTWFSQMGKEKSTSNDMNTTALEYSLMQVIHVRSNKLESTMAEKDTPLKKQA